VRKSISKTGRVVIVEESPRQGGIGAEIAATIAEEMSGLLKSPLQRVAAPNTPAPFSPPMEKFYIPDVNRICAAVLQIC
jgi:pyruvate dehydrogenase E1 component beta subunit